MLYGLRKQLPLAKQGWEMREKAIKSLLKKPYIKYFSPIISSILICCSVQAGTGQDTAIQACIGEMAVDAPDDMTIGEMRAACKKQGVTSPSALNHGIVSRKI